MSRFIFGIWVLFQSIGFFAQNRVVKLTFQSTETPCEIVPKQVTVRNAVSDAMVFQQVFNECLVTFELATSNQDYRLEIQSQVFESQVVVFAIDSLAPDTVSLGIIQLKEKSSQIDEVTITGIKRKFIEIEADRTTVTIKDNPILEISSLYDAILKIPGVMPFPSGGFVVGSQMASVYFDNIPSTLGTEDLMNLLKSLPANTAEKLEIISNPGAAYDANLSGAIINVLSHNKPSKWLSGTVTVGYGFNQNQKFSPSILLDGRRSKWSWQVQAGYSYTESRSRDTSNRMFTSMNPLVGLRSDRREKTVRSYYYFKPTINLILSKRTNLSLSYNGSYGDNQISGTSYTGEQNVVNPLSANMDYRSSNYGFGNQGTLTFKHEFDTLHRNIVFTSNYNNYQNTSTRQNSQSFPGFANYSLLDYYLNINRFYAKLDASIPFEKIKFYLSTGLKYSLTDIKNKGSYNLNNPSPTVFDDQLYNSIIDFDFYEDNVAMYVDLKKRLGKKVTIGAGLRAENYTVRRKSNVTLSQSSYYFNLFPAFNVLYRVNSIINIIGNYSRKIGIPSFSQYDPNNTGYYDAFSQSAGNPLLRPNFYDNAEFKITVLDYIQVSFSYSHSQFLNLNEIVVQPNSIQMLSTYKTYNKVNGYSVFAALPVPFAFFTKGLKMLDEPIEVDKMSFLYLYSNYTTSVISGYNYQQKNKGLITFGVYSQFILPWKIRLNLDYYITGKGNYQIYQFYRNQTAFDVVLSRDFLDKQLRVSLSAEDVFNTSLTGTSVMFPNIEMKSYNKTDTRVIRAKVSFSFGRVEKKTETDLGIPDRSGGRSE